MLTFGRQDLADLDVAARREWLVADGLGGYAMGTLPGLRTRRYHGLLVVATRPPGGRMLGLAALDPTVVIGERRVRLAVHEWVGGAIDPAGHVELETFHLVDGLPVWRWSLGDVVLERRLAMAHGRPAVAVVHRLLRATRPVRLELSALCTWRDVHGDRFGGADPACEPVAGGFVFEGAYRVAGAGFRPAGGWYRGERWRVEAERGLSDREDLWHAGDFLADLALGEAHEVLAWAGAPEDAPPPACTLIEAARSRAVEVGGRARPADDVDRQLALAADQLIVAGPTVVAGYPWFGEWSRDTMTSYEGLLLETGREDEGRALLRRAAATLSEGMLANTADAGATEYNTADGTLWFLHAVGRHVRRTGDRDLAAELLPALVDVVDHHLAGTRYGIRVDPADGLLTQGTEGLALTWMDARVDGVPVTRRAGKAVEINALWISGLQALADLAGSGGDRYRALRDAAAASFVRRFVRDGRCLDVVDGPAGDDASLRPNQLLAVSLPGAPLAGRGAGVVDACGPLLTSLGLRSLAPGAPGYRGRHRGTPAERDAAYHQGTVWPWLIGPYVEASLRCGRSLDGLLDGLDAHLGEWGVGSVSETAEGDAPHTATGCPFQAWSVAELMRARRLARG
ncbi:MAG TPA: amylo-alpha-1,6-glucosidase [Candidatus Dormibacteraeota bacterium]|nr:amylo-alpha-1,6-glucosidase [Candidatus Dormibacteraeota bacterium]